MSAQTFNRQFIQPHGGDVAVPTIFLSHVMNEPCHDCNLKTVEMYMKFQIICFFSDQTDFLQ